MKIHNPGRMRTLLAVSLLALAPYALACSAHTRSSGKPCTRTNPGYTRSNNLPYDEHSSTPSTAFETGSNMMQAGNSTRISPIATETRSRNRLVHLEQAQACVYHTDCYSTYIHTTAAVLAGHINFNALGRINVRQFLQHHK